LLLDTQALGKVPEGGGPKFLTADGDKAMQHNNRSGRGKLSDVKLSNAPKMVGSE